MEINGVEAGKPVEKVTILLTPDDMKQMQHFFNETAQQLISEQPEEYFARAYKLHMHRGDKEVVLYASARAIQHGERIFVEETQ
jgi:hypothetical protein